MSWEKKIRLFSFIILIVAISGLFLSYKNHKQKQRLIVEPRKEINLTIIPGWNLKQVGELLVKNSLVSSTKDFYDAMGAPAFEKKYSAQKFNTLADKYSFLKERPVYASYEGFLLPDTYRVYANSNLEEVLDKVFANMEEKITPDMREEIKKQGKTFYQVLTMASIVEREAGDEAEMKMVADIFWRRLNKNWALQSCATVNYVTGKSSPAVSGIDKQIDSPYNTYKYPGLPPGPIGNPSLTAIKATIYPTANNYWYFMAGTDGITRYARTLDEHNRNVYKYLR